MNPLIKSHRFGAAFVGLFISGSLMAVAESDPVKPLTDNLQPPHIGVYERCIAEGIHGNERYADWLNRTSVWAHDTLPFGPDSTWEHVSGKWQDWFYDPWSEWVRSAPGRRMVLSIPLLPGLTDGSGSEEVAGAGHPVSLKEGATGAYNEYFRGLAETLVERDLGHSILRPGWEWNGNWYTWKVTNESDALHFAAYWRQIVDTIRSVPGTENLKFNWNVTSGFQTSYDPALAYPGDAYVDQIGIDVYDQTWVITSEFPDGIYPLPPGASVQECDIRHRAAWDAITSVDNWGIDYWQIFADAHGKPLTIPEWGLIERPEPNSRGGLDNPYFIERMFEYINDPKHNVFFASYFDFDADADGNSRVSKVEGREFLFPKSAALYQKLFSLPQNTTAGN